MKQIVYIEGIGHCKEITVNRYVNGVNEPYNIYEPIEDC